MYWRQQWSEAMVANKHGISASLGSEGVNMILRLMRLDRNWFELNELVLFHFFHATLRPAGSF